MNNNHKGSDGSSSPVGEGRFRKDHELPAVTSRLGWRFHHVGIPTTLIRPGEVHIPHLGMHVSAFETSPFGIQWMRFDADSPLADILQRLPHVAFVVDDLDAAVEGRELIGEINSPSPGLRVAMILDHDAPVELMEFTPRNG